MSKKKKSKKKNTKENMVYLRQFLCYVDYIACGAVLSLAMLAIFTGRGPFAGLGRTGLIVVASLIGAVAALSFLVNSLGLKDACVVANKSACKSSSKIMCVLQRGVGCEDFMAHPQVYMGKVNSVDSIKRSNLIFALSTVTSLLLWFLGAASITFAVPNIVYSAGQFSNKMSCICFVLLGLGSAALILAVVSNLTIFPMGGPKLAPVRVDSMLLKGHLRSGCCAITRSDDLPTTSGDMFSSFVLNASSADGGHVEETKEIRRLKADIINDHIAVIQRYKVHSGNIKADQLLNAPIFGPVSCTAVLAARMCKYVCCRDR